MGLFIHKTTYFW